MPGLQNSTYNTHTHRGLTGGRTISVAWGLPEKWLAASSMATKIVQKVYQWILTLIVQHAVSNATLQSIIQSTTESIQVAMMVATQRDATCYIPVHMHMAYY